MGSTEQWWARWAPYWEHVEDRHLSVFVTERFIESVVEPVLVVGAGQGLIVERLRAQGLEVEGVDLEPEMVRLAEARRGLKILHADARSLPLADGRFSTVIVSTGVVDYMTDADEIRQVLEESFRVLRPRGVLFVAFYQVPRALEEPLRFLGVLQDGEYRMSRLFEVRGAGKPLGAARKIARWTGRPLLPTMMKLIRLGLALPAELRADARRFDEVVARAEGDGVGAERLREAVPDRVPYRGPREVRELFQSIGYPCARVDQYDDCLVARLPRLARCRPARRSFRRDGPRTSRDWVIRAEEVSKGYDGAARKAVDSLSLVVERGTIFGLLGPNGAGKTTTLSMLCGLLEPDQGKITFLGGLKGRKLKQRIGYVPQELAIYPKLTAWENMLFFGRLYGVKGQALRARAEELIDMVGLLERRHEMVGTYSTGMQRRLNLAAGLIHGPDLILLDEPTVGIDPQSRNCIFEAVLDLKRKGVSVIYTTHYMEEASRLCDRIVIIDEGRVLLEGDPREAVRDYGLIRIDLATAGEGGLSARLAAELEAAIWDLDFVVTCQLGEAQVSATVDRDVDAMDAVRRLIEAGESVGVELVLSAVVEPTLETLFLEITGKSLRDVGADPMVEWQ